MNANLRYQNGYLYESHGAWFVRYRQRILQEDGSGKLNCTAKHLGRCEDFSDISEVKRCRTAFMQTISLCRCMAAFANRLARYANASHRSPQSKVVKDDNEVKSSERFSYRIGDEA
jgi:hypothetical protein